MLHSKAFVLLPAVGLLSAGLAGCGAATVASAPSGQTTTITAWLPAPSPGKPIVESPLQFATALWNKEHPKQPVKLVLNQAIPFASFLSKLTTAFVGHNPPDIAYGLPGGWPFPMARGGYLAPINHLTPTWVKTVYFKFFYPSLRAQMPIIHGNIYALPTQSGGVDGLWYRKDWFQANHLPIPNTWANLLKDAKFFASPQIAHHYHIVAPFLMAGSATQPMETAAQGLGFFFAAGGHIIQNGSVTVDSPPILTALNFLRTLSQQHLLPRIALTTSATQIMALLAKGKVPMVVGGSWQYIALQQDGPFTSPQMGRNFQWIPFPRMSSHSSRETSPGGADAAIVAANSHAFLATQLLELSLSPAVAKEEAAAEQAIIAKEGLKDAPAVELPPTASELSDMVGPLSELQFIRQNVAPVIPLSRKSVAFSYGAPVQIAIGKMIDDVVWGSASAGQATRQAAKTIEAATGLR